MLNLDKHPVFSSGTDAQRLALATGLLRLGTLYYATDTMVFWHLTPGSGSGAPVWKPVGGEVAISFPHHYLVDNSFAAPVTPTGPFPTITEAIARATADGYGPDLPATIEIVRGNYTEDFTLPIGISLVGESLGPFGSTIIGTVTISDVTGAITACQIVGLSISPVNADALVFAGTSNKQLFLQDVFLTPQGLTSRSMHVTNNGNSAIIGINCNSQADGGLIIEDSSNCLLVWQVGGLQTQGSGVVALHGGGGNCVLKGLTAGSGKIEVGPGNYQMSELVVFGPVSVSGSGGIIQDLFCVGTAADSPLHVEAGASVTILGTLRAQCDNANRTIISGSGTVSCPATIQVSNGELFSPNLTWGTGNMGRFEPKIQIVFTTDPSSNPFEIPAGTESVVVYSNLTADWTFELQDATETADGVDVMVKNLDAVRTHEVTVAAGDLNRVPGGTFALAPGEGISARSLQAHGGWITF